MIFNMSGGGGGSGGLNLQFVGSMTAPSNPKENMIWVKTDRAITQFLITRSIGAWSQQVGAVEMTYKASDDYTMAGISTLFFNGKLHGVYGQAWFYPTALYQSNGITAEPKDAYIYKSGTWVQFSWTFTGKYLLKGTDRCSDVTSGWDRYTYNDQNNVSISDGTDFVNVNFAQINYSQGYFATNAKISFSGYSTLCIEYEQTKVRQDVWLTVHTVRSGYNLHTAKIQLTNPINTKQTQRLDVKSIGSSCYVRVGGEPGTGMSIKIYKIWLEK